MAACAPADAAKQALPPLARNALEPEHEYLARLKTHVVSHSSQVAVAHTNQMIQQVRHTLLTTPDLQQLCQSEEDLKLYINEILEFSNQLDPHQTIAGLDRYLDNKDIELSLGGLSFRKHGEVKHRVEVQQCAVKKLKYYMDLMHIEKNQDIIAIVKICREVLLISQCHRVLEIKNHVAASVGKILAYCGKTVEEITSVFPRIESIIRLGTALIQKSEECKLHIAHLINTEQNPFLLFQGIAKANQVYQMEYDRFKPQCLFYEALPYIKLN